MGAGSTRHYSYPGANSSGQENQELYEQQQQFSVPGQQINDTSTENQDQQQNKCYEQFAVCFLQVVSPLFTLLYLVQKLGRVFFIELAEERISTRTGRKERHERRKQHRNNFDS